MMLFLGRNIVDYVHFRPNLSPIYSPLQDKGPEEMTVSIEMLVDPFSSEGVPVRDANIERFSPKFEQGCYAGEHSQLYINYSHI